MKRGRIVSWKPDRGFGIIQPDDGGSTVFLHFKACEGFDPFGPYAVLYTDDGGPRPRARRAVLADSGQPAQASTPRYPDPPAARQRSGPAQDPTRQSNDRPGSKGVTVDDLLLGRFDKIYESIPYDFVPVPSDRKESGLTGATVVSQPIPHDGRVATDSETGEALLSGELCCELRALTPLLVGHDQVDISKVRGADERGDSIRLPPAWRIDEVSKKKKLLEPLCLPGERVDEPGPVVIAGAAIKGMLRHSIGALLAAPMERVEDRSYHYRPNMSFGGHNALREGRPAIVVGIESDGTLLVDVLPEPRDAVFVREEAKTAVLSAVTRQGTQRRVIGRVRGISWYTWFDKRSRKLCTNEHRIVPDRAKTLELDHHVLDYHGGIDGSGKLTRAFDKRNAVYSMALVPRTAYVDALRMSVAPATVQHALLTQDHLADQQTGHLRNEHPLSGKAKFDRVARDVAKAKEALVRPGQLIYVEVEMSAGGQPARVTSLGPNFRYPWRYGDTIRTRGGARPTDRAVLRPHLDERPGTADAPHAAPEGLTAARGIFGYVVDQDDAGSQGRGTLGIGRGDFTRVAGRVAVNSAIESDADATLDQRFVSSETSFVVPLKPLGLPRASAVELYLEQLDEPRADRARLATYGDLPDEPSGRLRGRKFYPHQSSAADDPARYTATDQEMIKSDQSMLARYVSAPGRAFRFKVRFRLLRSWELGALVAALDPQQLADFLGVEGHYAVKLGHGRPLGLGSARVSIDHAETFNDDGDLCPVNLDDALGALAELLAEESGLRLPVREKWLDIHRFDGSSNREYPTHNKKGNSTIFNFHTETRRQHLTARRKRPKS